ncbi:MAG: RsbRD N-terminal domain-containing protein, partial [Desulfatitalea sp.]|nr:RsbRD N-terminal domain-containing protein [Desulfatitalea sp.]
ETLIELLSASPDPAADRQALDPIIRIRAIQDFTASRAVRFVFDLKAIIHAQIPDAQGQAQLDARIDELALTAFDLYMSCREKIYDLKANEVKQRTYKAFAKAGLIKESDDE